MVTLVQLTPGTFALFGPGRVLRAATALAILDAEQLLTQARREADALLEEASRSVTAIEAAARETGLREAQREIQQRLTTIAAQTLHIMEQNKERIVDMGLQIARRVIDTVAPDELAVQAALRGLKTVGPSRAVRLRVAPPIVKKVRQRLDELLPAETSRTIVEVAADAQIKDVGCILETDAGFIDLTIETQLTLIENALRKAREASS